MIVLLLFGFLKILSVSRVQFALVAVIVYCKASLAAAAETFL